MIECRRRAPRSLPNILLDPKGSLDRIEYLKGFLILIAVMALSYILGKNLRFITFVLGIVGFYSSWVIIIKRLRFVSLSPWISLCCLIPFVSLPLMVFLIFYDGRTI